MNTRSLLAFKSPIALSMLLCAFASMASMASEMPPNLEGNWIIPDDDGKQPSAVVTFTRTQDGSYRGVLTKLFTAPGEDPNPKCVKCQGEKHNRPYIGLEVLWNLRDDGKRLSGLCVHPDDGVQRTCTVEVAHDGASLKFSMRIFALFNISEKWTRAANVKSSTAPLLASAGAPCWPATLFAAAMK